MGSLAVCMFNSRMSLCVCVCVCVGVCVSERERERESVCVHVLFVILCVRNLHVPMMFPQYFQLQNWAVQKRPSMCFLTTRILTIRVLNTPVRTKRIFTIRKLSTNTSTPRILTAASSSFWPRAVTHSYYYLLPACCTTRSDSTKRTAQRGQYKEDSTKRTVQRGQYKEDSTKRTVQRDGCEFLLHIFCLGVCLSVLRIRAAVYYRYSLLQDRAVQRGAGCVFESHSVQSVYECGVVQSGHFIRVL